jgi:ribosomal protein S18 acetylase RimI-like enzyme
VDRGIRPARIPEDLDTVRELFREYAGGLGVDLAFQGFEAELAQLPGKYAPPEGGLLLLNDAGAAMGCVGLRPLAIPGACEMKRLYVRGAARGTGAGRALAEAAIELASALGYRDLMLDTMPSMVAAIALYRRLGFAPVPAYGRPAPGSDAVPDLLYFRKSLRAGR